LGWEGAKPDATVGTAAGTLGALLRIPYEALATRIYAALPKSGYPDIREAHGAVFRHLPLAGTSISDLARRAGMAKQSMGYLVDALLELGYLETSPDPADRRAKLIRLSSKGMEMQKCALQISKRLERDWTQRIGEVEMGALRALLKVLNQSIEEESSHEARGNYVEVIEQKIF
jgi:DNA-binding MarR family transcriptional regulator